MVDSLGWYLTSLEEEGTKEMKSFKRLMVQMVRDDSLLEVNSRDTSSTSTTIVSSLRILMNKINILKHPQADHLTKMNGILDLPQGNCHSQSKATMRDSTLIISIRCGTRTSARIKGSKSLS